MSTHVDDSPADLIARWRRDPVAFIAEAVRNPETGQPFTLYPAEEAFLREGLRLTPDGRLPYAELVYSAPKKSGKTTLAAIVLIYVTTVLGGRYAEGYCCANDSDQAQGRVFQAAERILRFSVFRKLIKFTDYRLTFDTTGSTIQALANDFSGNAGANPTITVFDELWGYVSERSTRAWDEMVPPPTRRVATRLTVTYAGFEGESTLLEALYKRGLKGEEIAPGLYRQPGMLMYWSHEPVAPWQTPEWLEQMRQQLRPNAYARMIENRFVSTESTFIDMAWWDACIDAEMHPVLEDPRLAVWVGLDASTKRDSTALVACAWNGETRKVRLIAHRIFQPTPEEPLDFEASVETTLLDWRERFRVLEVRFDPYQLVAVAQRLAAAGVPMVEFPQSVPNLTESSTNLYELIKGRNLEAYADAAMRLAIQRCIAIESARGWRITKEKATHKIDVAVALAFSALGAVRGRGVRHEWGAV